MIPVTIKILVNNNAKFEQTKNFQLASLTVLFFTHSQNSAATHDCDD